MSELSFEWDDAKAEGNLAKHGVAFQLAVEAFYAEDLVIIEDHRRNYGENRLIAFASVEGIPLYVAYTPRQRVVRIISARKQSSKERAQWR